MQSYLLQVLHSWVENYLRLLETDTVNGCQGNTVKRVNSLNILNHIDIVLYRVKVKLRVAHAHHLVVEETIEVAVVAVNIEGVLSMKRLSSSPPCQGGSK